MGENRSTILAIDTSARYLSCAYNSPRQNKKIDLYLGNQFTERCMPHLNNFLATKDNSEHVGLVVYGNGPGSFTGIRIAISIAAALALANTSYMLAISSFSAYAYEAVCDWRKFNNAPTERIICQVLIAAGRSGYYYATISVVGTAEVVTLETGFCIDEKTIKKQCEAWAEKTDKWIACGDAWRVLDFDNIDVLSCCIWCSTSKHPKASTMLTLAKKTSSSACHRPNTIPKVNYLQASV